MSKIKKLLLLIALLIFIPSVMASEHVIINSENWQDVYNGVIFANINKIPVNFVTNYDQGITLINLIKDDVDKVILIQSSEKPIISVLQSELEKKHDVEFISGNINEINLELADKSNVNDFIVMDDSYGHNALSIGGYSTRVNAMPLFVDKRNVEEVVEFIEEVDNVAILMYGKVDREVKGNLEKYTAEHVNEGDKFSNNLNILEKHLELGTRNQLLLTNGNFIELELLSGNDPVVLVGNTIVPEEVIESIKESGVEVGVAIGTGIVGNAQRIRDEAGLKIYVKFAQGRNEQQMPLDMFEIPTYEFELDIEEASYNKATKEIEITFDNPSENYLVIKGNYEILVDDEKMGTFNDEESLFVSSESKLTELYNFDLNNYLDKKIVLRANVLMGEDDKAFENVLRKDITLNFVEYIDDSNISIVNSIYNKNTKRFEILVRNLKEEDVYVRAELVEFVIDDEEETLTSNKIKIEGLSEDILKVKAVLEPVDLADNEEYAIRAYYGKRENILVKIKNKIFEIDTTFNLMGIFMFALISLLIIIALIFMEKKRKDRQVRKEKEKKRKILEIINKNKK